MPLAAVLLTFAACEPPPEEPPLPAVPATLWQDLGTWSGEGDRQTESFDVTSGGLRLAWESVPDDGSGRLRVALHSSISGRPLQTIVDARGTALDTAYLTANPRVAYLRIESDSVRWRVTLQEAVASGR